MLLAATSLIYASGVIAAPIAGAPTTYCGDPTTDPSEDTGAGTMIQCDTHIKNHVTGIDPVTGIASGDSVISVKECRGPASGRLDPSFLTCSTDEQNLVGLVTHVKQCNGVGYGGGNVLECHVHVTTTFVGVTPQTPTAATVRQCNNSAPDTTGCDPFPATTTNATITQCNNSSYGGGQEDFNCLASGMTTSSLSVTVAQCNNSNYGGGSWLNCSTSLRVVVRPAGPTPTAKPTGAPPTTAPTAPNATAVPTGAVPTPAATKVPKPTAPTPTRHPGDNTGPPPTNTDPLSGAPQGESSPLLLAGLVLLLGLAVFAWFRRRNETVDETS